MSPLSVACVTTGYLKTWGDRIITGWNTVIFALPEGIKSKALWFIDKLEPKEHTWVDRSQHRQGAAQTTNVQTQLS